jgi:ATP-dependent DNA helicase RecG
MTKEYEPSSFKERQRKAVDYVQKQGAITRREYASLLNLRQRQASEDLSAMIEAGMLKRQGAGRSTRYVLADRTG